MVEGARTHSLRKLSLNLPHDALIVIHGVSGSGKSSLAFDTLFREGQRRYLRTLSAHSARLIGRLPRPEVDTMRGVRAALAVGQSDAPRSARSTVGTLSAITDELRLLFARFGRRHCPGCDAPINTPESPRSAHQRCACGTLVPALNRSLLSFNTAAGACPKCRGLGVEDAVDPELLVADATLSIRGGALVPTTPTGYVVYSQVTPEAMNTVAQAHGFDIDTPWQELSDAQREVILYGSDRLEVPYGKHSLESRMKWTGIKAKPREMGPYRGLARVIGETLQRDRNANILRFVRSQACSDCEGSRLGPAARAIRLANRGIAELATQRLASLPAALAEILPPGEPAAEQLAARIGARSARFAGLGLGHLSLDRASNTLSSGESRRLALATQLGIDLRGLLIVYDEASAGAHVSERAAIAERLREVRDAGNTVLLVEHDPDFRRWADYTVEIGPGAGTAGGRVLHSGPPRPSERLRRPCTPNSQVRPDAGWLTLRGIRSRNLQIEALRLARRSLNVVCGVSGAGKSTLVEHVLGRALAQRLHGAKELPGEHAALEGYEELQQVILVDQAPIGRSVRSNPATYSGAFDRIRALFAATEAARAQGLGKGDFSFNKAGGRCERCEGAGVELLGLMSLGSASLPCPLCNGKRFQGRVLSVRCAGHNILELLDTTISEARNGFAEATSDPSLQRILEALIKAGLGYLTLGQPATTLSGGEAQRLKLASQLARSTSADAVLLLDEATNGLHPKDIEGLVRALEHLADGGATIIAADHDLHLLAAADRVVDLGPGAGPQGGRLLFQGSPAELLRDGDSPTAQALREASRLPPPEEAREAAATSSFAPRVQPSPQGAAPADQPIQLRGVRTRNLKGVDADFPHAALSVVTGVSGSGKSSLAFATLAQEGRRRFAESLSPHLRRELMANSAATLDGAHGLRPTVAIRTDNQSSSQRSTVGTLTGADLALRLLFSRSATAPCPTCERSSRPGHCPCGDDPREPWTAGHWSPQSPLGACPRCEGRGEVPRLVPERLIEQPDRTIASGALATSKAGKQLFEPEGRHHATLLAAAAHAGLDLDRTWEQLDQASRVLIVQGQGSEPIEVVWEHAKAKGEPEHRFVAPWTGIAPLLEAEYAKRRERKIGPVLAAVLQDGPCPACEGERLRPELARARVGPWSRRQLGQLPISEVLALCEDPRATAESMGLDERAGAVFSELAPEVRTRLRRLPMLGLGHLSLDRRSRSLSGGEARRVAIAAQLVEGLTDAAYVLDEPSLGLHPQDVQPLAKLLKELAAARNTVVLVEHEESLIAAADHILEIGPGAGPQGGEVLFAGTPDALLAHRASPTARALRTPPRVRDEARAPAQRDAEARAWISVRDARLHNLKGLSLEVHRGELLMLCGVSGSGKSTLARGVLAASLQAQHPVGCGACLGAETPPKVADISGRALGAGPASLVGTAIGALDPLRALFAKSADAKAAKLSRSAFTFGNKAGACPECKGSGEERLALDFLPDAVGPCPTCRGQRYRPEVLACRVAGHSLAELLAMAVGGLADALGAALPASLAPRLALLEELGLGHLALGRRCDSLSGGESQRLAVSRELLASPVTGAAEQPTATLFLFDEPSRGLHAADLPALLFLLERLTQRGQAVLVIEHELRLLCEADRILELGPSGGPKGGQILFEGLPAQLARADTPTGQALRHRLGR